MSCCACVVRVRVRVRVRAGEGYTFYVESAAFQQCDFSIDFAGTTNYTRAPPTDTPPPPTYCRHTADRHTTNCHRHTTNHRRACAAATSCKPARAYATHSA
eukprot:3023242-Prymnesium_polylepis.1